MAVRETHILLDFIADADPLREINNQINNTIRSTRHISRSYNELTNTSRQMMREMNTGWRNQSAAFLQFRNDLVAAEYEYHNLSRGTAFFGESTDDLIRAITHVGAAHRRATNGMLDNDERRRRSLYRTIGTMANMTTQAQRNYDALERMNNPLYNANRPALRLLRSLEQVAVNANTSRVALELLGPTASIRELNEEVRRLNRGLGAMPIVALGAAVTGFFMYKALHKASMSNKEYARTFENMLVTLRLAFQPMVNVWRMIMVPLMKFVTWIANLAVAFNKAHPYIAMMIQGTMMLIPILTLLLLPLGLGVGLVKGYALAFGYFYRMVRPFITFMATMSATVWIVAAAIILLGAAFIWAWNNVEWFRDGIIAAWTWIKEQTLLAFEAIKAVVMPAIQAIVAFGKTKLDELKVFWAENGTAIIAVVVAYFSILWNHIQMYLNIIKGIFQIVFPQIVAVIKVAWALIQTIISTTLNIAMGVIKAILAIIKGDWEGAWDAIKGIFTDTWEDIKTYLGGIDLMQIGKDIVMGLIKGVTSMIGGVGKAFTGIVGNIKDAITGDKGLDINSPSKVFHEYGVNTWQGFNNGQLQEMKNVQSITNQVTASIPTEYARESGTSTSTTNNSQRSVTFSPVITIQGGGNDSGNVKQIVQEALDEAFSYFSTVYTPEVDF